MKGNVRRLLRQPTVRYWAVIAVITIAFLGFDYTAGAFQLYLASELLIYAIAAVCLAWLQGRAGLVSIGSAALMGLGALTTAVLSGRSVPFPLTLLASLLIGAIAGLVFGLPALRLRGIYLAFSTLAMQFIFVWGAERYQTGLGAAGLAGLIVLPPTIGGVTLMVGPTWDLLLFVVLALTVLGLNRILGKAPGRAWTALRDSESAASIMGVDVARAKLAAFVGSSAITALAGGFLAYFLQVVTYSTFSLDLALAFVVMIIVGGERSMVGALMGAALVTLTPYWLQTGTSLLPHDMPGYATISQSVLAINGGIYGLILLFFIVYVPDGLAGGVVRLGRWIVSLVASKPPAPAISSGEMVAPASVLSTNGNGSSERTRLELAGVSIAYRAGAMAVEDLSLKVPDGRIVALLGPNGAGKTSTLRAIAGVLPHEGMRVTGTIRFDGREIAGASPTSVAGAGIVFVPERDKVFPSLTVREHFTMSTHGDTTEATGFFPPLKDLMSRRAGLLSGGERQMLALAVAISRRPRLLMIDELSLGLAPIVVKHLMEILRTFHAETGTPILLVEQNADAALAVADDVYILESGRLVGRGDAAAVAADDRLRELYLGAVPK
jgi:branched-chain amino acid transport system permease protein